MILNTILCLLLLGNLVLLILVYRTIKSQPKHIEQADLDKLQDEISKSGGEILSEVRTEVRKTQDSTTNALTVQLDGVRTAFGTAQKETTDTLVKIIGKLGDEQTLKLKDITDSTNNLTQSNETRIEDIRKTVDQRIQNLQTSNEKKLDQMRETVDEKLQKTLEDRLTASFNVVNKSLKDVQEGLGKMESLAADVGNLQSVLTNVSTRGAWGEVQLGAILEQILTPDQYAKNVQPHTGNEKVEYAVRLPGNDATPNTYIWLPIDSKFPMADYQRIVDAAKRADKDGEKSAIQALKVRIQSQARDISEKYVLPPHTTDFAIMFLPTEGLYAEILRQPGLVQELIQDHRIVVAGPTTLTAILLGLRVGFRTLAIQKHSGKIQEMLAAVKTEFREYSQVLGLTQRHLRNAANALEKTEKRSQAVVGKLQDVEELPMGEAAKKLGLPEVEVESE